MRKKISKVYISSDMEGISGIVDMDDTQPMGRDYQQGRKFMTDDVNAAVRGALAGGATEIVVNDAHGPMRNILPEQLHKKASLIRGKAKPMGMLEGLDETFDAIICIGFHARAGENGVLSHSFMGHEVEDIWLNGRQVGEIGLLYAAAKEMNVPVVMLTGDNIACKEIEQWDATVQTVSVKESIDRFAANLLPNEEAVSKIEATAKAVIIHERLSNENPYVNQVSTLKIRWQSASVASHLAGIPGVVLCDARTVEIQGTVAELYRLLFVFFKVAASMTNQQPYC
jgi:D-amino peptidase